MLDTNVVGTANTVSALLVNAQGWDQFVAISSLAAHRLSSVPGNLVYSLSKISSRHIVLEFRKALRERGRGERVSLVSPGFVRNTEWAHHFFHGDNERAEHLLAGLPSLTPAQVADAVLWILEGPPEVEISEVILRPPGQPD